MMPQVHLLLPVVTSLKPFGFCPQAQPRLHSASRGPEGRRARLVDERVQEAERRFPGGKADAVEPRENGCSRGRRGRSACHALRATCHAMGPLREDLLPTGDRFQKQQRAAYRSQPRSTGSSVHRAPRCRGTCHSRPHTLKQTDHRLNGLLQRRRQCSVQQPKEAAGPLGGLPTPCVVPQCGRWQRRLLLVRAHLHRRSARTHGDGSGSSN